MLARLEGRVEARECEAEGGVVGGKVGDMGWDCECARGV